MRSSGSSSAATVVQTLSADGALNSNTDVLYVTASCTVALPAVSASTTGKPKTIFLSGTSAIVVKLVAAGSDKVEGAAGAVLYATRGQYTITPVAANRWALAAPRGRAFVQHALLDLSSLAGASPWPLGSATITDSSGASSSVAASSGLELTSKSSSSYTGASAPDCAMFTLPCSGVLDAWGRPVDLARQRVGLYLQAQKTTTVGGSLPSCGVAVGNGASGVPRISAHVSGTTGVANLIARDSVGGRSLALADAAFSTVMGWIGLMWDPVVMQVVSSVCATSPSGTPGLDWAPPSYETSEGMRWGQDTYGVQWPLASLTHFHVWQTTPTTGSKFKAFKLAVVIEIGGLG